MKYFEEAKDIWQSFVPKTGQSETVQGELLRAVEKLRTEALDNGNMNWDEGFEILLKYLESKLTDRKVYSEATIGETQNNLTRLENFDNPYLKDDLYDELTDRVVEYFNFYGSQSHTLNINLKR